MPRIRYVSHILTVVALQKRNLSEASQTQPQFPKDYSGSLSCSNQLLFPHLRLRPWGQGLFLVHSISSAHKIFGDEQTNEWRKERLLHFTDTGFGKKILCNLFSFDAISNVEKYKDALLQEYSSFIIDYMLHGNPVGAKTWCHIFISLFPFQKKKL